MSANNKIARLAGLLYIIIVVSGIFAEFMVRENLIVPGDAVVTAQNIMASEEMFRMSIAGDIIMIMADVALGLAFYILLKPVNNALALLAAFFRLAQATILGFNLLNLYTVLQYVSGDTYLSVLGTEQLYAHTLLSLSTHSAGYSIGLIFFGFSILILGYLIYKSGYLPRILGALLIIAALGYIVDSSASLILPNYADYAEVLEMIMVPAFIVEPAIGLWLLIKGVRTIQPKNQSPSLKPALVS